MEWERSRGIRGRFMVGKRARRRFHRKQCVGFLFGMGWSRFTSGAGLPQTAWRRTAYSGVAGVTRDGHPISRQWERERGKDELTINIWVWKRSVGRAKRGWRAIDGAIDGRKKWGVQTEHVGRGESPWVNHGDHPWREESRGKVKETGGFMIFLTAGKHAPPPPIPLFSHLRARRSRPQAPGPGTGCVRAGHRSVNLGRRQRIRAADTNAKKETPTTLSYITFNTREELVHKPQRAPLEHRQQGRGLERRLERLHQRLGVHIGTSAARVSRISTARATPSARLGRGERARLCRTAAACRLRLHRRARAWALCGAVRRGGPRPMPMCAWLGGGEQDAARGVFAWRGGVGGCRRVRIHSGLGAGFKCERAGSIAASGTLNCAQNASRTIRSAAKHEEEQYCKAGR
ncbi:hypothetical protein C8R44DRAFT_754537 [Mycena epipterygia]|nr:hypothetical protein C8R44DRAFT_754537 [Mycena epipterygia]